MKKTGLGILGGIILSLVWTPTARCEESVNQAPLFSLPSLHGQVFSFPESAQKKLLVVNFFASWCTSCIEEIPLLESLKSANPNAVFIGINAGETQQKAERFLDKRNYPWNILLDQEKTVTKKFGVLSLPVTLVIAPNGKILYHGARPPESLATYLHSK